MDWEGGGGYGRGLRLWQAQVRLAWNELQILLAPFQGAQEKEEGNETSGSKRRCLTAKGQPGVAKGMGMVGSCCNLNAYVSFLGALESSVRPSVCSSSRVESSLASFRGAERGGAGWILLPPAVNIYACVLFIYIVKTNFAQGFNCFSLLCHAHSLPTSPCNPLQLHPCAATVSDTHAKHGRKCCLFSIKNLSSTIARSKLIPGPFIGSRQVLNRQIA